VVEGRAQTARPARSLGILTTANGALCDRLQQKVAELMTERSPHHSEGECRGRSKRKKTPPPIPDRELLVVDADIAESASHVKDMGKSIPIRNALHRTRQGRCASPPSHGRR